MPMYLYTCCAGHETEEFRYVSDYVEYILCKHRPDAGSGKLPHLPCGLKAFVTITTRTMVGAFKPYMENNLGPEPMQITSRAQRDALCEKHGVTYDSNKFYKKPKYRTAVEDLDLGTVKQALQTGRDTNGNKLK